MSRPALRSLLPLGCLLLAGAAAAPDLAAQRFERPRDFDREAWLEDCEDGGGRRRSVFCEVREAGWRQAAGRSLTVDASPNGAVEVHGWDRDSVHVIVKLQAHAYSEAEARELVAGIRIEALRGTLRADGPPTGRSRSWSVSYEAWVPTRTDLTLDSRNGPISASDVEGSIRMSTQNGPMVVRRLAGDVRARTQNGPLVVELDGRRWQGAGLDAETSNGPLVLEVPDGYSAQLETGTINGPMIVGFPVTVQGRIGRSRLHTTLGGGGPPVRAVTTNGPATIRRS